jgi:hypothetical protein
MIFVFRKFSSDLKFRFGWTDNKHIVPTDKKMALFVDDNFITSTARDKDNHCFLELYAKNVVFIVLSTSNFIQFALILPISFPTTLQMKAENHPSNILAPRLLLLTLMTSYMNCTGMELW